MFGGGNFVIVDNTKYGPISSAISKAVNAFLRKPIENPIGKKWIKQELEAKGKQATLPRNRPDIGGGSKSARKISDLAHPRKPGS